MSEITEIAESRNYKYCQETKVLKDMIEDSFIELGIRLLKIRETRAFDPAWTSFGEFCLQLDMKESQVSKLINIYQKYMILGELSKERVVKAGGWSKLAEPLPLIKTKEDAIFWIEKLEVETRDDIRKDVIEMKTGILQIECPHHNTYDMRVCRTCQSKWALLDDK